MNIGILAGAGELSEYSLCISGVLGGFKELKKSVNIGGLISYGDDVTSSINTGLFADIVDHTKKSLNFGVVCAQTVSLESSVNAGGIASLVKGDAKNSCVIGLYNKTKTLTDSLSIGLVNVAGEDYGYQTGVVDNSVVAGLYNKTEKLTNSLEMGVVNVAGENLGWQIGIVNICKSRNGTIREKETKGKSIGLVNIDLDKKWYESVSLFYG